MMIGVIVFACSSTVPDETTSVIGGLVTAFGGVVAYWAGKPRGDAEGQTVSKVMVRREADVAERGLVRSVGRIPALRNSRRERAGPSPRRESWSEPALRSQIASAILRDFRCRAKAFERGARRSASLGGGRSIGKLRE